MTNRRVASWVGGGEMRPPLGWCSDCGAAMSQTCWCCHCDDYPLWRSMVMLLPVSQQLLWLQGPWCCSVTYTVSLCIGP